jgi:regulator of protease activity HflC (stomatin/prohibitin superfamily)
MAEILVAFPLGFIIWFFTRYGLFGFYTIGPNERAVITTFGRAQRVGESTTLQDPISETLRPDERQRYEYPQVRVVGPGFYWKLPWQRVHKVSIATVTVSIAYDPEDGSANHGGRLLEAVTKDQLNTGLSGQLRFTVAERNLYAYLFGVKNPVAHVMGYFISVLRDRIANFEAPPETQPLPEAAGLDATVQGISINDLRKNLRDLGDRMDDQCASAAARYGIDLDAALTSARPLER